MSKVITELTPEQEAMIPTYLEKWINMLTKEFPDKETKEVVTEMYASMGYKKPDFQFEDSPLASERVANKIMNPNIKPGDKLQYYGYVNIFWMVWAGYYDFANYLGVEFDQVKLKLFIDYNSRMVHCVPFDELCVITRKPIAVRWKDDKLHADGEPAMEFRDGYGLYCYEGVRLPEHIGKVKAADWDPKWVFEAKNADMRAILIKGMGIDRFISASQAEIIDTMEHTVNHPTGKKQQVYELLRVPATKIGSNTDLMTLKMTCPSTGHTHVHGVPPGTKTCLEAYKFMWKGKTPQDWAVEA